MPPLSRWALAAGVVGVVLTFSLPPDPLPYLGVALMVLAPVLAVAALVSSGRVMVRVTTALIALLCLVPLGLLAWVYYLLAHDAS